MQATSISQVIQRKTQKNSTKLIQTHQEYHKAKPFMFDRFNYENYQNYEYKHPYKSLKMDQEDRIMRQTTKSIKKGTDKNL